MKYVLNTLLLVFIFYSIEAQMPCNHPSGIVSSKQLYETLINKPVDINPRSFVNGCNITDSIKRRLIYLLNWRWTKDEIKDYYKKKLVNYKDVYFIEEKTKKVSKGNDSLYKIVKDSIENEIVRDELKYDTEVNHIFNVKPAIILTVGWLNMKETIPFLRDSAINNNHYDRNIVELSLARMGDEKLQKKIINSCRNNTKIGQDFERDYYDKYKKLIYINTQESLYQLNEFIDTSKYVEYNSKGLLTNFAHRVVQDFISVFGNEEFKKLYSLIGDEVDYNIDAVLAIKRWIIKNKGKYIIKKRFCPY
jgi:hypothetical protein